MAQQRSSAALQASVLSKIAAIKAQNGDRLVRVIVAVQAGNGSGSAALELAEMLRRAGAVSVQPIQGQPLIVVECRPSVLESVAQSGLIADVSLDSLDAAH